MKNKSYLILLLTTIMLLSIEFILSSSNGYFTRNVILIGTCVLAGISILSYYISSRNVNSDNPNQFVRGVMGGTFLKFFLCIVAAAIFIFLMKKNLHKPDLFLLMFVYLVFTVLETGLLFVLSKQKK
jgi:hypothetical protein